MALQAINIPKWVEEHKDQLVPPVGNALMFKDGEFQVMIVRGPNSRRDFHQEPGEEIFYQLEGGITVKVIEDGQVRDVHIREGEIFLLPANVIHSPRRPVGTLGLALWPAPFRYLPGITGTSFIMNLSDLSHRFCHPGNAAHFLFKLAQNQILAKKLSLNPG